jgi:hypothetical protein
MISLDFRGRLHEKRHHSTFRKIQKIIIIINNNNNNNNGLEESVLDRFKISLTDCSIE